MPEGKGSHLALIFESPHKTAGHRDPGPKRVEGRNW